MGRTTNQILARPRAAPILQYKGEEGFLQFTLCMPTVLLKPNLHRWRKKPQQSVWHSYESIIRNEQTIPNGDSIILVRRRLWNTKSLPTYTLILWISMKQWSGKGEIQLQHHGQRRPRSCSPVFDSEHYPRRKADDIKIDTPHSKKTATSAYKSWSKGQQWCVVRWTGDAASRGPTIEGESRMFDEVSPPRSAGIWCRNHFTNSIITDFAKAVNSRRRNLLNRIWEYHRLVNGPMFLGWKLEALRECNAFDDHTSIQLADVREFFYLTTSIEKLEHQEANSNEYSTYAQYTHANHQRVEYSWYLCGDLRT